MSKRFILKLFSTRQTSDIRIQLLRYCISGGVAFLVDFFAMLVLHEYFNLSTVIAATVGFVFGVLVTYLFSILWIFDNRRIVNKKIEFLIFVLIALIGIALTYFLMNSLEFILGWHYTILKVITTVVITVFNFIAKKFLLFSNR